MSVSIKPPTLGTVKANVFTPMRVDMKTYPVQINTTLKSYPVTSASITIGLVCGVGIGAVMLCGSDGALVTIDGNYLIVRSK